MLRMQRMQRNHIERLLGYAFRTPEWLERAFTHPSAAHTRPDQIAYERLEYLGDAVLELVVSTELFCRYADADEGTLSRMRAAVVSRRHLAQLAEKLGWGEQLIMSQQLERTGGRSTLSVLANTFESVIGAVMMDADYEAARQVSLRLLDDSLQNATLLAGSNPKGELQEALQALSTEGPTYSVVQEPGLPPAFSATALWRGHEIGHGSGSSKHKAEIAAAADAIRSQCYLAYSDGASSPRS